jgi:ribonuclease BN (tRNA processing enzyme)
MLVSEVLIIDDLLAILKKNGMWDKMSTDRQVGLVRHLREDHLTPEQVGKLASRADVKRVVLTHTLLTGNDDEDTRHYLDGVKKFYSGPVELAKDLKQF